MSFDSLAKGDRFKALHDNDGHPEDEWELHKVYGAYMASVCDKQL